MIARPNWILGLIAALLPGSVLAQEVQAPDKIDPDGTEILRGLLHHSGIRPHPGFTGNARLPRGRDTMLIIYGSPGENFRGVASAAQRIIREGGSVLIAIGTPHDLASYTHPVDAEYRVDLPNLKCFVETLTVPNRKQTDGLPYFPECPYVKSRPFGDFFGQAPVYPKNPFEGLGRVATNRPASLKPLNVNANGKFIPFAYLPPSCRVAARTGPKLPDNHLFAVAQDNPLYVNSKIVLMADEDVLSNQMIANQTDTDNLAFTLKLIDLLADKGRDNKTHCLFFEYGERKDQFDTIKFGNTSGGPPVPIPSPFLLDAIGTQVADAGIDQIDQNQVPDKLLSNDQRLYARIIMLLILIGTALLLFGFIRRAFARRYQPDRLPMPLVSRFQRGPQTGLKAQIRQEVVVGGDFGPMIRDYLRTLFDATGVTEREPRRMPRVEYSGQKQNKPALMKDLEQLWTVAYGPVPKINLTKWKDLEPMIVRVWKAADAGRWRFLPTEES